MGTNTHIFPKNGSEIFFTVGLGSDSPLNRFTNFDLSRTRFWRAKRRVRANNAADARPTGKSLRSVWRGKRPALVTYQI